MNNIHILDCTLRDGGYCNQWEFGFSNIKKITSSLVEANIDIVECGFLTDRIEYKEDISKFDDIDIVSNMIPKKKNNTMFVVMMNYGEYDVDRLPIYNEDCGVDGIRVAFHKKDYHNALKVCRKIQLKGYKVFIQAMVSLCYKDEEFLELIHKVNQFKPYAFYIVDSFGMMKSKDLTRLFYMIENNLDESIWIGFHSHNNMQLAYSNAQTLVGLQTRRNLILDSSIYGMGRGAGNLNTEIFVEYLNNSVESSYDMKPLLSVIDEILSDFYNEHPWGYSLPNYLSAKHNIHPNYAIYLDNKKTLTVDDINEIFLQMDEDKRFTFNKTYIEQLYVEYMTRGTIQIENSGKLKEKLYDKSVLLIAPGKSSVDEIDKIKAFTENNNPIVVSINHEYELLDTDYVFLSNLRRFREIDESQYDKCILTSNIKFNRCFVQASYNELLNNVDSVSDNAGLMAIKFLMLIGVEKIYLAGFDGYSQMSKDNYGSKKMSYYNHGALADNINIGITKVLKEYSKHANIDFVTTPKYVQIIE